MFLSETPFYPEMGGQVGDTGELAGMHQLFIVQDTISPYKGLIAHQGKLKKGVLRRGDLLTATIDRDRRQKIANNHTATHLLHWALHQVLGEHIKQAGSVVDPQRLRFDFSHHKALSQSEIRHIEDMINEKIRQNLPVNAYEMKYEDVQGKAEIKQFFGEKYGNTVRVIDIDYSKELCGGTHTSAVGNIGLFRIAKESSIAAGIRRIEAVTGKEAEDLNRANEDLLLQIAQGLKIPLVQVREKVEKLSEENKQFAQELKNIKKEQLKLLVESLLTQEETSGSITFILAEIPVAIEELRACLDLVFEQTKAGLVVLAAAIPEKCQVMVRVGDECIKKGVSAHAIIQTMMPLLEGSGGGKPNMAQGGGKSPQKLREAFQAVRDYLLRM